MLSAEKPHQQGFSRVIQGSVTKVFLLHDDDDDNDDVNDSEGNNMMMLIMIS